jgi:L,D-transpeptidase ErfK/SrfK
MFSRIHAGAIASSLALCLSGATASGAELRNDIIGGNEYYRVKDGDTLLEIARLHDLGFIELVSANPGIDPWIPAANRTIMLPSEHASGRRPEPIDVDFS